MLRDGITGDWCAFPALHTPHTAHAYHKCHSGLEPSSATRAQYGKPVSRQMRIWQQPQLRTSPREYLPTHLQRTSPSHLTDLRFLSPYNSKIWDTHTGECKHTLQHSHICRAVAFPIQPSPQVVATGGFEKKLRIFDLTRSGGSNSSSPTSATPNNDASPSAVTSYEIGPGVHGGTIKSIVWNQDYNILTTAAEDRKIRWWDLRSRHPVVEYAVEGTIGSCELNSLAVRPNDAGILTVAAGRSVYLFDGLSPGRLLKKIDFRYEVASAAVNNETSRLVTGSAEDTWARVYDVRTEEELGTFHPHFNPTLSIAVHFDVANNPPQRFKKAITARSGLSVSRLTANCMVQEARMERSSCGRLAGSRMASGGDGTKSGRPCTHILICTKTTNNTKAILPSAELWWHGSAYTLRNCGGALLTLR